MTAENIHKYNKLRLLIWLFPLSVCVFIFSMSAMGGDDSSELSTTLLDYIEAIIPAATIDPEFKLMYAETILRKMAHITEFTLLAVSFNIAFYVSLMRGKKEIWLSLILSVIYAMSDELHQILVPERSPLVSDVLIDCIGPLVLTLILLWLSHRHRA